MFHLLFFSLYLILLCPSTYAQSQGTAGTGSSTGTATTTATPPPLGSCSSSTDLPTGAAPTLGFAMGGIRTDGSCKNSQDLQDDLKAIDETLGSKFVRVYSTTGYDQAASKVCEPNFLESFLDALAAYEESSGTAFSAILGLWPDPDPVNDPDHPSGPFSSQYSCLLSQLPTSTTGAQGAASTDGLEKYGKYIYGITVGSEGLYRGTYTGEQLNGWIQEVKGSYPDLKIGTADVWANLVGDETRDVLTSSSLILANEFPVWEGTDAESAPEKLFNAIAQAFCYFEGVNKDAELWVGETGWPSDGDAIGPEGGEQSELSKPNENSFFQNGICPMVNQYQQRVFAFEAFDEPFLSKTSAAHWGVLNGARQTKNGVAPTCTGDASAKSKRSQITAAPSVRRTKVPLRV